MEDRAITEVVRMQEESGLPIGPDGEYRRKLFFSTVVATAEGFDPEGFERSHRDEQGKPLTATTIGKLVLAATRDPEALLKRLGVSTESGTTVLMDQGRNGKGYLTAHSPVVQETVLSI